MNRSQFSIKLSAAQSIQRLLPARRSTASLLALAVFLAFAAISCRTVKRVTIMLPEVPGAKYIGSKECEQCHEELYKSFQTADHSLLTMGGPKTLNAGCESCHGPASIHSESGGETKTPNSFAPGRPMANNFGAHFSTTATRASETVCFTCHGDVRGQFNLPSHHPVPEGRLACIDCHPPHKGSAHRGGGTLLMSENEACIRCHPAQRGPFVFEHEAVREGCVMCHNPHGSVNAKMLTVRDANLCLKCHFQQVSGGSLLIGGSDHTVRVQQGACWSAGCHESIHGSRVSPSLRF